MLAFWREGVRLRAGRRGEIADVLGVGFAEDLRFWLNAGQERARTHGPLAGVVAVLRAVLEADDRAERVACLLSDIVLARALNWKQVLPISAQRLTKAVLRDLVAKGQGAELVVQTRILESVEGTIQEAPDLARRAETPRERVPCRRRPVLDRGCGGASVDAVAPYSRDLDPHD